jgi:hypothetical protein
MSVICGTYTFPVYLNIVLKYWIPLPYSLYPLSLVPLAILASVSSYATLSHASRDTISTYLLLFFLFVFLQLGTSKLQLGLLTIFNLKCGEEMSLLATSSGLGRFETSFSGHLAGPQLRWGRIRSNSVL